MRDFYFTLGTTHGGPGHVRVTAPTFWRARDKMALHFSNRWCTQYQALSDLHPDDCLEVAHLSVEARVDQLLAAESKLHLLIHKAHSHAARRAYLHALLILLYTENPENDDPGVYNSMLTALGNAEPDDPKLGALQLAAFHPLQDSTTSINPAMVQQWLRLNPRDE